MHAHRGMRACSHMHTQLNPSLISAYSASPTTPALTAGLKALLTAGAYAFA